MDPKKSDDGQHNKRLDKIERQISYLREQIKSLNEAIQFLHDRWAEFDNWSEQQDDDQSDANQNLPNSPITQNMTITPIDSIHDIMASIRKPDFQLTIDLSKEKKN